MDLVEEMQQQSPTVSQRDEHVPPKFSSIFWWPPSLAPVAAGFTSPWVTVAGLCVFALEIGVIFAPAVGVAEPFRNVTSYLFHWFQFLSIITGPFGVIIAGAYYLVFLCAYALLVKDTALRRAKLRVIAYAPSMMLIPTVCLSLCATVRDAAEPGFFFGSTPAFVHWTVLAFFGHPAWLLVMLAFFLAQTRAGLQRVEQFMPARDPSCKKCGYSLKGLRDPRCPECGQPFDSSLLSVERAEVPSSEAKE